MKVCRRAQINLHPVVLARIEHGVLGPVQFVGPNHLDHARPQRTVLLLDPPVQVSMHDIVDFEEPAVLAGPQGVGHGVAKFEPTEQMKFGQ